MKHLPTLFERVESTAIFIALLWLFGLAHYSWLVFVLLLFTVDVSMLGYLVNPRVGAVVYNLGHNYSAPVALLLVALLGVTSLIPFSIIWAAHIAMDRALGYGLKFDTGFQDTHLGKIGKNQV